jgi:hypothetical protein
VARRVEFLTAYQNADYAARYTKLVDQVKAAEAAKAPGKTGLADAVARYLFKLMAYKDEYEVARLYAEPSFLAQVKNEVAGDNLTLKFHLAPPLLAQKDPVDRRAEEDDVRPVDAAGLRVLAKFKFLRGTPFDIFGYSEERTHRAQADRRLRGAARRDHGQAHAGEPPHRGRARGNPGEDPRLRPRARRGIWWPRRPTRPRCSTSSASRAARRCSKAARVCSTCDFRRARGAGRSLYAPPGHKGRAPCGRSRESASST